MGMARDGTGVALQMLLIAIEKDGMLAPLILSATQLLEGESTEACANAGDEELAQSTCHASFACLLTHN